MKQKAEGYVCMFCGGQLYVLQEPFGYKLYCTNCGQIGDPNFQDVIKQFLIPNRRP